MNRETVEQLNKGVLIAKIHSQMCIDTYRSISRHVDNILITEIKQLEKNL